MNGVVGHRVPGAIWIEVRQCMVFSHGSTLRYGMRNRHFRQVEKQVQNHWRRYCWIKVFFYSRFFGIALVANRKLSCSAQNFLKKFHKKKWRILRYQNSKCTDPQLVDNLVTWYLRRFYCEHYFREYKRIHLAPIITKQKAWRIRLYSQFHIWRFNGKDCGLLIQIQILAAKI